MKILAVDDKVDNIELIADVVEGMGFQILRAFSGLEALTVAREQAPDLILLDVHMPKMSGFEVVSELKGNEKTADIPIILITGLADIDSRVEGLGLGADDYLTKPFNPRELAARIETRLRIKAEADNLRSTKEIVLKTFERFVSPSVVQQLLEDPSRIKLGGTLQEITVFFADLENFTAICEHAEPPKLLAVLNRYHELLVQVIQANLGTIDKFLGDGVMALYNTPLMVENHPLAAVKTAYKVKQVLQEFHPKLESEFRININFGIHTGMAIVGNVGAPELMDFTAVGDTVNVAARLQGLSQNGQILISSSTYERIKQHVVAYPVGQLDIKGRSTPVMAYETLSVRD